MKRLIVFCVALALCSPVAAQIIPGIPNSIFNRAALDGAPSGGSTITLDPTRAGSNQTFSNGNLTTTLGSNTFYSNVLGSGAGHSSGKYYYELTITTVNRDGQTVGIGNLVTNLTSSWVGTSDNNSIGVKFQNGSVLADNISLTTVATVAQGNTLSVAVDLGAKLIWFRTNAGNWNNNGTADPATGTGGISFSGLNSGPYVPAIGLEIANDQYTVNFGATTYSQSVPSGFGNW